MTIIQHAMSTALTKDGIQSYRQDFAQGAEYSWHPLGYPLLLSILVKPFSFNEDLQEISALLISLIAALLSCIYFYKLVGHFTSKIETKALMIIAAFVGTPIWHFSRALYPEALLTLCTVGCLTSLLVDRSWLRVGLFAALGIFLKPVFVAFAIPTVVSGLALELAGKSKRTFYGPIFLSGIPIAISIGFVLFTQHFLFGSLFHSSQDYIVGWPPYGLIGLIFDPLMGAVAISPQLLFTPFGWIQLFSNRRRELYILGASVVPYFIINALWLEWWGGFSFGPRLIVPIIPIALLPLAIYFDKASYFLRRVIIVLIFCSVITNGLGALCYKRYLTCHPILRSIALRFGANRDAFCWVHHSASSHPLVATN